jgi:hypothetical protein
MRTYGLVRTGRMIGSFRAALWRRPWGPEDWGGFVKGPPQTGCPLHRKTKGHSISISLS